MQEIGIPGDQIHGNVAVMKARITNHLKAMEEEYRRRDFSPDSINFWSSDPECNYLFETMCVVDHDLVYGACTNMRSIYGIAISRDRYGLRGEESLVTNYEEDWGNVSSMAIVNNFLYVSNHRGIGEISLSSSQKSRVIHAGTNYNGPSPSIASFKAGILYTDPKSHRILQWKKDCNNVQVFAGNGNESNKDGLVKNTEFYQPAGVCVEFDHVVYVCDSQTHCIKVFTTLNETAEFLSAVGKIYKAFSVHEKHQPYELCSIDDAITLIKECLLFLRHVQELIRNDIPNLPKYLNGPEGMVANKTVESVEMIKIGLERLATVLHSFEYRNLNLLSCTTMDVENFHSVVHHKAPLCTVLDYARDFGNAVKEGLKRTTKWAAFYYTNSKLWYPVPNRSISLSNIPLMPQLQPKSMTLQDIQRMRDWAQTYGAAVRQCSVRQETTMSKAGTLPGYLYDREIQPGETIDFESGYNLPETERDTMTTEAEEEETDEMEERQEDLRTLETLEFDSSSDEEA